MIRDLDLGGEGERRRRAGWWRWWIVVILVRGEVKKCCKLFCKLFLIYCMSHIFFKLFFGCVLLYSIIFEKQVNPNEEVHKFDH